MEGTNYTTKEAVLKRAQEVIGIPLREVDTSGRLASGKGAIGTVLEESWFGYQPNGEAAADFPECRLKPFRLYCGPTDGAFSKPGAAKP